MKIKIFSTMPEIISSTCKYSILNRSLKQKLWSLEIIDIRKYGRGRTRRVDDYSYGGGGMVLRADVLSDCIEDNIDTRKINNQDTQMIHMSPKGRLLDQGISNNIASNVKELYILCSRFEGIDQRIIDYYNVQEISIGEYVILGGEIASIVLLESVIRLIPNALTNNKTTKEESFSIEMNKGIEYNQFTKPATWMNIKVPTELISGNHKEIQRWRSESSKKNTEEYLKTKNKT